MADRGRGQNSERSMRADGRVEKRRERMGGGKSAQDQEKDRGRRRRGWRVVMRGCM